MSAAPHPPHSRPRRRRAVWALGALLLVAAIGGYVVRVGRPPLPPALATVYPIPRDLPPFVLVDQAGARFDRGSLAGHYTLLFLGFTQCPDVCPATLATLAAAYRAMPASGRPAVVMVSVDPAHDTPAALAAFVPRFDPAFVGAVGDAAALQPLAAALGAYYAPGSADGATRVQHSGAVFLIDPRSAVAAVYTTLPAPAALAADVARLTGTGGI